MTGPVLAFDTSVRGCSVCISNGQNNWAETLETERGQAEMLLPMIGAVLEKSGYSYQDLNRIGVTTGPGSFTGLRVGLSTARALALTLNKPLLGFSTLEVLGKNAKDAALILIDTKRGDYYGQVFTLGRAESEPRIWTAEEVAQAGLPLIENLMPDVELLALMVLEAHGIQKNYDPFNAPEPVYLRGAEVSQSKRKPPQII